MILQCQNVSLVIYMHNWGDEVALSTTLQSSDRTIALVRHDIDFN